MKKYLTTLILFTMVALPAFSVMSTEEIMSDNYIRRHGHSEEMVKLIDLQNAQINGVVSDYKDDVPAYATKNKAGVWLRKFMLYVDPGLDNGSFGNNKIRFNSNYNDL